MRLVSIDLFSGVGGLSQGMHRAGFKTKLAVEIDEVASEAYKANHRRTKVLADDIGAIKMSDVRRLLGNQPIHLLAGCPPCQGFSSVRRLNRTRAVTDKRNSLINQYLRFVKSLRPYTIMMENVPGLIHYTQFKNVVRTLKRIGYSVDYKVVNVKDFGVPQSRKRLVLVGSRLGEITVAEPPNIVKRTVRDVIGGLPRPSECNDRLHQIYPTHSQAVLERIRLTPRNGGSRSDLPAKFTLKCHKDESIGFRDVYGRLKWDSYSATITGGCLNPSKGRFLHPTQNRTISAREASMLQSFPKTYKFPADIPVGDLALLIGNALPPRFSYYQSRHIKQHIIKHLD
jgi:DNA (cytosine-5)-methyltransferase 1